MATPVRPGFVRAAVLLALVSPAYLHAVPVPTGAQFQVNSHIAMGQSGSRVASDGAGNFIVAWSSATSPGTDNSFSSVQARRFTSTGTPLGAQFQVNTTTLWIQAAAGVAADGAGNFVVQWGTYPGGPVQAQWYDSAGVPQGPEAGLSSIAAATSGGSVGMDAAGNAVFVWDGDAGSDTSGYSIQARRFDATRTPLAPQFQVNTYTTSDQFYSSVAVRGGGEFLVVWLSNGSAGDDASNLSIQAQRYDATGTAVGTEFQVNAYTTGLQLTPAVAVDGAGNFTVVWMSNGSPGTDDSPSSIQARRYDGSGVPLGGEFQVNTYTTGIQDSPDVAADAGGNVLVVWTSSGSAGSDTSGTSIQAQGYDGGGVPNGGEFQVNSYTTGYQVQPSVAAQGAGAFVVTWSNSGLSGSTSVQAQRIIEGVPTTSTTTTTLGHLMPGRIAVIRPDRFAKFVAKPATGGAFALPSIDPVAAGGALRLFDTAATAGDHTYALPAGGTPPLGWTALGTPPGSRGYRYRGTGTGGDRCRAVVVKAKVVKAVCVAPGVPFTPPFAGDIGIVLRLGATEAYCARFGGDNAKNDTSGTTRRNAPTPAACP